MSVKIMRHRATGWRLSMNWWGFSVHTTGQREKTRMKESKYRVNGASQTSGFGERSVEMCVVTPSMRLTGMAPRATQRALRQGVISSVMCGAPATGSSSLALGWCLGSFLMAVACEADGAGGFTVIPVTAGLVSPLD